MLANDFKDMIPLVAVAGGFAVAIIGIVAGAVKHAVEAKRREVSRGEIGAYVAEGSVAAEDAQKLIEAGSRAWKKGGRC